MTGAVTYGPSVVWRFDLPIGSAPCAIDVPRSARVVHVGFGDGVKPMDLTVWVLLPVDEEGKACSPERRELIIAGTGQRLPAAVEHCGSVVHPNGLVFHVFERSYRALRECAGLDRLAQKVGLQP